MVRNKDRWSALSMQERADLIKLCVSNGITNIGNIRKYYNSFDGGGPVGEGQKTYNHPKYNHKEEA